MVDLLLYVNIILFLVERNIGVFLATKMCFNISRFTVYMYMARLTYRDHMYTQIMVSTNTKGRLKDSYSFETRMCGTVKCRPKLAYRVHFDSINISDWTDNKILLQREIRPMLF